VKGVFSMVQKGVTALLWVLLTLGAIGGIGTLSHPFGKAAPVTVPLQGNQKGEEAVALHVAKLWLTYGKEDGPQQRQKVLGDYFPTMKWENWVPPKVGQTVKELYVSHVDPLSSTFSVVTVDAWCELSTGENRHILLNIPVSKKNGEYAVAGDPVLLPPLPVGENNPSSSAEAPREMVDLATPFLTDFMRIYLTSSSTNELANMVSPGVSIQPLNGFVQFQKVDQFKIHVLQDRQYEAVMDVLVNDPVTQVVMPEQFMVDFNQDASGRLAVAKVWKH
jgi:hypothetical protein